MDLDILNYGGLGPHPRGGGGEGGVSYSEVNIICYIVTWTLWAHYLQ